MLSASTLIKKIATFTLALSLPLTAIAHERFILPSHTVLSGEEVQSVSFIASISNAIFHGDKPLGDNGKGIVAPKLAPLFKRLKPIVIGPDGVSREMSWQAFSRFSVADTQLEQSGTYRIALVQPDVPMTTFIKADGKKGRFFGNKGKVPSGATNIVKRTTASRVETYVSFNEPNNAALKATGEGLELGGETHPNDLFVDETIHFQLTFQGKPLQQSTKVKVVKGATRHRNQRDEKIIETDAQGNFSLTLSQAGFYLLSANIDVKGEAGSGIDIHHHSLYATLEVFVQ
ncbi:DUF4198 domain-containing protein [Colwellia psychrerythraea]|uniref:Nickel transport complex protein, NikM subunit, transmembrane n=1 Tax=Colwellia psychrerythraea TaxID=28229 RepID=A0A099KL19_COLPS|nr:DUF4198 domain-containing protein [Colwellia psychrerythraea]KGJ90607.1 Nickel transport complex protein, NikM subunit, transmembrane [Colwellia psychrerythraea]